MSTSMPVPMATTVSHSLPFSLPKLKPPSLSPSLFRRTFFLNSTLNTLSNRTIPFTTFSPTLSNPTRKTRHVPAKFSQADTGSTSNSSSSLTNTVSACSFHVSLFHSTETISACVLLVRFWVFFIWWCPWDLFWRRTCF